MELDLVTAVHLAGLALNDEALRRLHAAGHRDLRVSHGFVVQHVVEGPRPVGEIAERMGVTQQAASKAVAELVGIGVLESVPDPRDGRVRLVGLAGRGREVVAATRRIRADMEAELAATLGTDEAETLRTAALGALEWAGGADAVRARRVRPPT